MLRVLITIMILLPMVANAYTGEVEIDGIRYEISTKEQTANVLGPSSVDISGVLTIPSSIEYEGKTCFVKSVQGFTNCSGITSIVLGEGISQIADSAFIGCINLKDIDIPLSMRDIGSTAFDDTDWLNQQEDGIVYAGQVAYRYKGNMQENTDLVFKEGTISISSQTFRRNSNIKSVVFPTSLRYIGAEAFAVCFSMYQETLAIPDSVYVGERAFNNCRNLEQLVLGNGVKVDAGAFTNCRNLKSVTLGNVDFIYNDSNGYFDATGGKTGGWFLSSNSIKTVEFHCKKIGKWFSGKASITTITLGNEVEVIDDDAFSGCTGLTKVEFPNGLKYLSGFGGCTGLSEISIPSSVEKIGIKAFGSTGLTTLHIPANVKEIDLGAFSGCSGLSSVELSTGLKKIGEGAFYGCSGLTELFIPNSVDSILCDIIGSFRGCTSLKTLTISEGVKYLGPYTFSGCEQLTKVILPESIEEINYGLFLNNKRLNTVIIPSKVKTIYGDAFGECLELEDVYCYSPTVPKTVSIMPTNPNYSDNPFRASYIQYATLHVPAQAIEDYKAAKYWQDFKEIVAISDYEAKKCATPKINYKQGHLSFTCDTEGAKYEYEITDSDIQTGSDSQVELTVTYHVSVFATAPDHVNSDVATATLCWIDVEPKTEGITNDIAQIPAHAVLIQSENGEISVAGLDDGTKISVYEVNGVQVGTGISNNGQAVISTHLPSGSIAIVKIGEKSVKITMK